MVEGKVAMLKNFKVETKTRQRIYEERVKIS